MGKNISGLRSHNFKKGVSGNPNGQPKIYYQMQKLARSHSTEAFERLVEIMRNKRTPKLSLKAAELILDRAWGKAPQAIVGESGEGPIKFEVSWKNAEVATVNLTPNKDIPLLEAEEVPEDGGD
jgi:hypothetical protein